MDGQDPSQEQEQDRFTQEGQGPAYQPDAYQPAGQPARPAEVPIRKPMVVEPERPKGSLVLKLLLLALLCGAIFGGYYGVCYWKASDKEHALFVEARDLHNSLMRYLPKEIGPEEIREVVLRMAKKAGVETTPAEVRPFIGPMNAENSKKLTQYAQMGLGVAAQVPGAKAPKWVVGFQGRFRAKYGMVNKTLYLERYTWFKHVDHEAAGLPPPAEE